MFRIWNL